MSFEGLIASIDTLRVCEALGISNDSGSETPTSNIPVLRPNEGLPKTTFFFAKENMSSSSNSPQLSGGHPPLKLTATFAKKENGWLEDDCFRLGPGLFSGAFAVSFREGNLSEMAGGRFAKTL